MQPILIRRQVDKVFFRCNVLRIRGKDEMLFFCF